VFGEHGYHTRIRRRLGTKGAEIWRTDGDALVDGHARRLNKVAVNGLVIRATTSSLAWTSSGPLHAATWLWTDPARPCGAPGTPAAPGHHTCAVRIRAGEHRWLRRGDNFNVGMVHLGDTLYVVGIDLRTSATATSIARAAPTRPAVPC
jgi:hypothetical protein